MPLGTDGLMDAMGAKVTDLRIFKDELYAIQITADSLFVCLSTQTCRHLAKALILYLLLSVG